MSSATRGGWLWNLHKVKRPSAPIVVIEFHYRLGSGAGARKKVKDARILSTRNGNEVLNQAHRFGKLENALYPHDVFSIAPASAGDPKALPVQN